MLPTEDHETQKGLHIDSRVLDLEEKPSKLNEKVVELDENCYIMRDEVTDLMYLNMRDTDKLIQRRISR